MNSQSSSPGLIPPVSSNHPGSADDVIPLGRLGFIENIRPQLLTNFFDRFRDVSSGANLVVVPDALDDSAFHAHLRLALTRSPSLPVTFWEALHAIHALSTVEAQERLTKAAIQAHIDLQHESDGTRAELALRAWLKAPALFAQIHNELRLTRLSAFEYFGSNTLVPIAFPTASLLTEMQAEMDAWFARHARGVETVQIQAREMAGEFWFLIRHGDTYARKPRVNRRATEILQYRPAKDDVVVYSPERCELRVHAGTRGETEMYRRIFGKKLCGDHEWFSEILAYTLAPLHEEGADALYAGDIHGIQRIVLREVEVSTDIGLNEVTVQKSDDLFLFAPKRLPVRGELLHATFDIFFANCARPRKLEIRPPNILKLGRHCDASLVHRWLSMRGFRTASSRALEHAA